LSIPKSKDVVEGGIDEICGENSKMNEDSSNSTGLLLNGN